MSEKALTVFTLHFKHPYKGTRQHYTALTRLPIDKRMELYQQGIGSQIVSKALAEGNTATLVITHSFPNTREGTKAAFNELKHLHSINMRKHCPLCTPAAYPSYPIAPR
ncbi:MAG: hypothetical protein PHV74_04880 [Dehalococcoidia bacterium]|nr:hypothetical protein [Dehalococcoidia bacterium]